MNTEKVVVTNGCFDVLHAGHVKLLKSALGMGDRLIIGLNGDDSVKKLKGENRPINSEEDRALVLSELSCVDFVVIFNEPKASRFLDKARPNIYVKGGDYTKDSLDKEELGVLEFHESEIKIVPHYGNLSSTNIINKL